nr:hypothetical protein [Streptomyces sp. MBT27]
MRPADFDATAPNTLGVVAGPARVPAAPDACGTPALFGEEPCPRQPPPERRRAAPVDQDQLF